MTCNFPFLEIICFLAVCVPLVLFLMKRMSKEFKQMYSIAKEETSHFTGETAKNEGSHWRKIKWFACGAAITYFFNPGFFSFGLLAVLVLQGVAVFFITKKYSDHKSEKRKWYALGVALAIFARILIALILLAGSKDAPSVLFHGILLIALIVLMIYKNGKIKVLKNDTATRQTTGRITNTVTMIHKFMFITYSKGHTYEYEFTANGMTYKGADGEPDRDTKKRGGTLQNPVKVEYETDAPENSWLSDVKHRGPVTVFIATVICASCIIVHCILSTDIVDAVKDFYGCL